MQLKNSVRKVILSAGLLMVSGCLATAQQPDRGFQAANSYAAAGLGAVNLTNGNVVLNIPIASLPAGRGGSPGYSVNLQYNSKLWQSHQSSRDDGSADEYGNTRYSLSTVSESDRGGWRLASEYRLAYTDRLNFETPNVCWLGDPVEHLNYRWKVELEMPDGSVKQFFPVVAGGSNPTMSDDGYSSIDRNGVMYSADQGTHPTTGNCLVTEWTSQPQTGTTGITYITTDGSRLRLFLPFQSDNWKVFTPNGTVIEHLPPADSTVLERITDRNGNYVDRKTNGNIVDQLGRSIEITTDTNGDSVVSVKGVDGATVSTRIEWGQRWVNQPYRRTTAQNAPSVYAYDAVSQSVRTVEKIVFPTQLGTQEMAFDYYGDETPPQTNNYTEGWGEIKGVTLPTGAKTNYHFQQPGDTAASVLDRYADFKELAYHEQYDNETPVERTEKTLFYVSKYGGTVTSPSGAVSSEGTYYSQNSSSWDNGLAFVNTNPDGTRTERIWAYNEPRTVSGAPGNYVGMGPMNAFVKTEFTTLPAADGTFSSTSQTAIKDFKYDKNGNVLEIKEYDWVGYCTVRTGSGCTGQATVIPTGAVLKRITVNTYNNQATDAATSIANSNSYSDPSSPKLKNVIKSTEIQNGSGTPVSRTEFYYDDETNTGNLEETRVWDSYKGGTTRTLNSPDSAGSKLNSVNSISTFAEYDAYGNVTKTKDAKLVETTIVYGNVTVGGNSVAGPYPTQVETASNHSGLKRTFTSVYDLNTGRVTSSTDEDNDLTISTVFDALGRPTKAITASGDTTHESWTTTDYDTEERRVIVRSDVSAKGDGKKVAIQHYDELGRVRLSRVLEDPTTENPEDETDGIKVQTRYKYDAPTNPASSNGSYSITTNPNRALTSAGASGEQSMGWTLSYSNKTGTTSTSTTYTGSGLPSAFGGSNSATTGTVTTGRDGDRSIVSDQAGKRRISKTNALGQLSDAWEIVGASDDWTTSISYPSTAYSSIAHGYHTSYQYDTLNNLTLVDQGDLDNRVFAYSSLSRLLTADNPESGTISYGYDPNGNLTSKVDARSITTGYIYDDLNRVTAKGYTNEPSGSETADVTYTYDNKTHAKGKLTKVSSSNSITEYTSFDILGRVTGHKQTTDGNDYTTAYVYNLSGAMIEETYPSTRKVRNVLDSEGDLAQVQSQKNSSDIFRNYASSFVYTAAGAVSSMKLGNGNFENTQYNSRLQPTQIGLGASASTQNLLKLEYAYGTTGNADNNGNVLSQKITVPTVGSNAGFAATQTYTYDSLNRIHDAIETIAGQTPPSWNQTFKYDRYGNRNFDEANTTTLPKNCGTSPNFTVCTADKKVVNPAVNTSDNRLSTGDGYVFDNAGNTTRDAELRKFTYDGENKQIKVETINSGGTVTGTVGEYVYDGDGKRIKKKGYTANVLTEETIFVYDAAGRLVAEYSTAIASTVNAKISYLTNDHLGSPRINTDAIGNAIARHDYHPFGDEIIAAVTSQRASGLGYAEDSMRKQFTGYERDDETDLDFAQARMYSNKLGRFTTGDPLSSSGKISTPQTWNRFSYVLNNPLNLVDPSGLCSVPKDLKAGQVGICLEAFIKSKNLGTLGLGKGDNREHASDDPSLLSRVTLWVVISRDENTVYATREKYVGDSEAGPVSLKAVADTNVEFSNIKTEKGGKDFGEGLDVTVSIANGANGAQVLGESIQNAAAVGMPDGDMYIAAGGLLKGGAPGGTIDGSATVRIIGNGEDVKWVGGETRPFPSYGLYVYTKGNDGQTRVVYSRVRDETPPVENLEKPKTPWQ